MFVKDFTKKIGDRNFFSFVFIVVPARKNMTKYELSCDFVIFTSKEKQKTMSLACAHSNKRKTQKLFSSLEILLN